MPQTSPAFGAGLEARLVSLGSRVDARLREAGYVIPLGSLGEAEYKRMARKYLRSKDFDGSLSEHQHEELFEVDATESALRLAKRRGFEKRPEPSYRPRGAVAARRALTTLRRAMPTVQEMRERWWSRTDPPFARLGDAEGVKWLTELAAREVPDAPPRAVRVVMDVEPNASQELGRSADLKEVHRCVTSLRVDQVKTASIQSRTSLLAYQDARKPLYQHLPIERGSGLACFAADLELVQKESGWWSQIEALDVVLCYPSDPRALPREHVQWDTQHSIRGESTTTITCIIRSPVSPDELRHAYAAELERQGMRARDLSAQERFAVELVESHPELRSDRGPRWSELARLWSELAPAYGIGSEAISDRSLAALLQSAYNRARAKERDWHEAWLRAGRTKGA